MASLWSFICKVCGPSLEPCDHAMRDTELHMLREMREQDRIAFKLIEGGIKEIIHLLNRPQSATLHLLSVFSFPSAGEFPMPKTVAPGGTAQAVFQEWSGPSGTGTVVPNEGTVTFASDNPAVATVDPASGAVTTVAAGTANISGTDGKNSLTASDVLTVATPTPPAVSATLTLQ